MTNGSPDGWVCSHANRWIDGLPSSLPDGLPSSLPDGQADGQADGWRCYGRAGIGDGD
jgi:hypothetical protein